MNAQTQRHVAGQRTIAAQVAAYNEAIDALFYCQLKVQNLHRMLVANCVRLVVDSRNPRHVIPAQEG